MDRDAAIVTWCALDHAAALGPADREIAGTGASLRAVILEFAQAGGADEEIYDACAQLGRMVAEQGGSPSFASGTMDHAAQALGVPGAGWLAAARAAVTEAFTEALLEKTRQESRRSWEFPRCAVALADQSIAIAAGHPSGDAELLAEWAARIAGESALRGVRRAIVSGTDPARAAVHEALAVVGIESADAPPSGQPAGQAGQVGSRT